MDIPQVLDALGLADQDWGPNAQTGKTYAEFAATWRGTVPVPSEADMQAAWATIVANAPQAALQDKRARAKGTFDGIEPTGFLHRSEMKLLVRKLNQLSQWDMALKAAFAASATFLDLKPRIAALPNVPNLTKEQVRTELFGDIDDEV